MPHERRVCEKWRFQQKDIKHAPAPRWGHRDCGALMNTFTSRWAGQQCFPPSLHVLRWSPASLRTLLAVCFLPLLNGSSTLSAISHGRLPRCPSPLWRPTDLFVSTPSLTAFCQKLLFFECHPRLERQGALDIHQLRAAADTPLCGVHQPGRFCFR